MKSVKIALFDIDKTVIRGDSMFDLLKYTLKKYPKSALRIPELFIKLVAYKAKILNTKKAKESMFYTLNYLEENELELFYNSILKEKIFNDAKLKMKELKEKGYYILLVSASPECYLKFFEEYDYVDKVIGTRLECINDKYVNKIIGVNCKGEEKVERINEFLKKNNLDIDKKNSLAYSDSLSDKPMFNLVNRAYLINYKKKNLDYEILRWK